MGYKPLTVIKIIQNAPCDDTYSDVIKFGSAGEQAAYFSGLAVRTCNNCSYQRVSNSVRGGRPAYTCRVPFVADELYNCNYIMFQNATFGTKWFYAFIRQINYISPANTELVYEIDYYQTYQFNYKVKESFVEREHPVDDTRFSNSQPEPITISQTVLNEYFVLFDYKKRKEADKVMMWALTDASSLFQAGAFIKGVYSGVGGFECTSASDLKEHIAPYYLANTQANIMSISTYPFDIEGNILSGGYPPETASYAMFEAIENYVPKYQKVFSYPFCYFKITDSCGYTQDFEFEKFGRWNYSDGKAVFEKQDPKFTMRISTVFPPCVQVAPVNYSGFEDFEYWDKQIIFSDFPASAVAENGALNLIKETLNAGLSLLPAFVI